MSLDTLTVRVLGKAREAEDVLSFELGAPDATPLPAFTAGAHVDVHLPTGLVRQYSLCNAPGERHRYRIAVLREPASRGGSRAMHDEVGIGALLRIGAPRNLFALDESAGHTLLLAGGIGITPILAMAERLQATRRSFELHYAVRSRARLAFGGRLADSGFAGRVHLHIADGPPDQRLDLDALLRHPGDDTHLSMCGPTGLLQAARGVASARGWSAQRIHSESFAPAEAGAAGDREFEVRLAASGRVIRVPASQSVATALAAHGVAVPISCEQGICGTCLTRVIGGVPDHRDQYLTDEEHARNDRFTPCCSRAKGDLLVLDL